MTPPLLSRPVLDDLGGVIGPEKLKRLLDRFTIALRTAFPDGGTPIDYSREAHTLISMSGMLGCERLSEACRALEAEGKEAETQADLVPALAAIRALRDETVRALEALGAGDA